MYIMHFEVINYVSLPKVKLRLKLRNYLCLIPAESAGSPSHRVEEVLEVVGGVVDQQPEVGVVSLDPGVRQLKSHWGK